MIYSALTTALAVAVPVVTISVAFWQAPMRFLWPVLTIAGVIPFFITVPLALLFTYMMMKLNQTIAAVDQHVRYDNLTGILTRGEFLRQVESMRKRGGYLLLLDADFFKNINDTHGHAAGDEVLRVAAQKLERTVGTAGVCGRIGGEEFAVFLPSASFTQAFLVASGCCAAVRAEPIMHAEKEIRLTFSVGVAEDRPTRTFLQTMELADEYLYQAKNGGRDRVASERGIDQFAVAIAS